MMRACRLPARRPGYTLLELLVVIAIIAVLVGLLMAGVMAVMQARERTQTKYEISKLADGLNAAMKEYGGNTRSLPGKLVLFNSLANYSSPAAGTSQYGGVSTGVPYTAQDVAVSRDTLRKMFGVRLLANNPNGVVYWDGSSPTVAANANNIAVLEGQHCLVFYLGGIATPTASGIKMNGFSADVTNPSAGIITPGTAQRKGPFYEFPPNRLQAYSTCPGFYAFLDPYGTPFAYFGQPTTGKSNNYYDYCPSLGVHVYYEGPTSFTNPDSFQIISAGRDRIFGAGGLWNPSAGASDGNARDDLANFSQSVLAAPKS